MFDARMRRAGRLPKNSQQCAPWWRPRCPSRTDFRVAVYDGDDRFIQVDVRRD